MKQFYLLQSHKCTGELIYLLICPFGNYENSSFECVIRHQVSKATHARDIIFAKHTTQICFVSVFYHPSIFRSEASPTAVHK